MRKQTIFGIFALMLSFLPTASAERTISVLTPKDAETICDPACKEGQEVIQYVNHELKILERGVVIVPHDRYVEFNIPEGMSALLYSSESITPVMPNSHKRRFPAENNYTSALVFKGDLPTVIRGSQAELWHANPNYGPTATFCLGMCELISHFWGVYRSVIWPPGEDAFSSGQCVTYTIPEGILFLYSPDEVSFQFDYGPRVLERHCSIIWIFDS